MADRQRRFSPDVLARALAATLQQAFMIEGRHETAR